MNYDNDCNDAWHHSELGSESRVRDLTNPSFVFPCTAITVRLTPAVRTVGEGSDATLSVVLSSAPQDSAVTVDFTTQDLSAIGE